MQLLMLKYKFMSENLNSKNLESDEFNLNTEESDYKYLINRLKEIEETISFLGKTLFK